MDIRTVSDSGMSFQQVDQFGDLISEFFCSTRPRGYVLAEHKSLGV